MQYSPKLKNAIKEIKQIIEKYDIGAVVVLHSPGHAEFYYKVDPGYSCIRWIDNGSIRFNIKLEHYENDKELREKFVSNTANMLNLLAEVGGRTCLQILELSDKFDEFVGAEHTDIEGSSEQEQNN